MPLNTRTKIKRSRESLILLIGLFCLFALLLGQLVKTSIKTITRKSRTNLVRKESLRDDIKTRKDNAGLGSHL
jgi:hypothetical protein